MNEAVGRMLDRYNCQSEGDYIHALREIMQQIALLGLWRSRFFEHAAFYGGTALRILYGLDRYSEDLDFSLLAPDTSFELGRFGRALELELGGFGFEVQVLTKEKKNNSVVRSAFLKANTLDHLIEISPDDSLFREVPPGRQMKIKLEVDTDPPPGFTTDVRFMLQPVPFSVRSYSLPSLFAGKMHAVLCRGWQSRVKGRDWYDLVWYAANFPHLNLNHLRERMCQSGHWEVGRPMTVANFKELLAERISALNIIQARREVRPFVRDPSGLEVWSEDFFNEVAEMIRLSP